ncbi:MAG: 3-deoxy-manno-octulosonate cytidylyltransferase [SAR86 cluster bacterium]|uniref:3-deoxy-manno-octulosonate cytidylyltransferase n=1 Tax=SAR86 cluster bacterium TaxID=2030880 RepID=A0A2A4MEU7_9GAMM|nr:MAG: 3-deoxy-manno-octulosonate cytidylyltransferase [SAR86 cluster bacterium]
MSFTVVIPARFASTRLPGKPLLDIGGKPMLQHVYERACKSEAKQVFIATDDRRIFEAAQNFGAKVCMTRDSHVSGTDRIQEVASQLGLAEHEVVVNVQGDEPLIPVAAINQVAENLIKNPRAGISSLCEAIQSQDEIDDSNAVKVVLDNENCALYFSRASIPWHSSALAQNALRHIGIYAYRVSILNQFVRWAPTQLEVQEKLEQLRALVNGVKIHMDISKERIPAGVDTEKDLEAVRLFLAK